MALFGRSDKAKSAEAASPVRPVMGREALCSACNARKTFSRCWMRVEPVTQCSCCGLVFPNPRALYAKTHPACPQCGEFLEQPGFEYGLCDTCGSKYELVQGTKPGLLPNKKQRAEMDKVGKVWRRE